MIEEHVWDELHMLRLTRWQQFRNRIVRCARSLFS